MFPYLYGPTYQCFYQNRIKQQKVIKMILNRLALNNIKHKSMKNWQYKQKRSKSHFNFCTNAWFWSCTNHVDNKDSSIFIACFPRNSRCSDICSSPHRTGMWSIWYIRTTPRKINRSFSWRTIILACRRDSFGSQIMNRQQWTETIWRWWSL